MGYGNSTPGPGAYSTKINDKGYYTSHKFGISTRYEKNR
jgi:hypothetical protein